MLALEANPIRFIFSILLWVYSKGLANSRLAEFDCSISEDPCIINDCFQPGDHFLVEFRYNATTKARFCFKNFKFTNKFCFALFHHLLFFVNMRKIFKLNLKSCTLELICFLESDEIFCQFFPPNNIVVFNETSHSYESKTVNDLKIPFSSMNYKYGSFLPTQDFKFLNEYLNKRVPDAVADRLAREDRNELQPLRDSIALERRFRSNRNFYECKNRLVYLPTPMTHFGFVGKEFCFFNQKCILIVNK